MKAFVIPAKVATLPLEPKKRGSGGTPDVVRQAKSKQALQASGGRRVSVNLSGASVADLEAIKARHGVDSTGAIVRALQQAADSDKA